MRYDDHEVSKMIGPYEERIRRIQEEGTVAMIAWIRDRLAEISTALPGRVLEFECYGLTNVRIDPAVEVDGVRMGSLEDLIEREPQTLGRRIDKVRVAWWRLQQAGTHVPDRLCDPGCVSYDPDEDIDYRKEAA